ncbi:hypothetical protein A1O3_07806 [Capronia epimyces CBS 606.96]|uniref:Fe2OG dioxygenase domain-containing protein n=1 Tax=Capronia epimyces CBS 606.96 TaxID=1182542 RepID=W9XG93_9EURO|nr:uncharacterized protein A1O3_07806 [Capronia epimyces CBS 606.96]EXJ79527.1 hypothetical protein A1O3_07806 [Capronia epimyces CBS 606.96]
MKELGLNPPTATSPIAITEPFLLFTVEGVKELRRDLSSRDRSEARMKAEAGNLYRPRECEALLNAVSQAAGVELVPVFDYDIAHTNVQVDAEKAKNEDIYQDLPDAEPPKQPTDPSLIDQKLPTGDINDKNAVVGDWHNDVFPWVCVLMLSDPTGMSGGETALRKGDGSFLKVRGPELGYAVVMQGGSIHHAALKQHGAGERITMVTSLRPKDPLAIDGTTLGRVKIVSDPDALFKQWTTYRMDVVSARALALKKKFVEESLSGEEIREEMKKWVDEQKKYLDFTVTEMEPWTGEDESDANRWRK